MVAGDGVGERLSKSTRRGDRVRLGQQCVDVAVISRGEPTLAAQTTIDFGLVLRTPMIEIATIGAGGGSSIVIR